MVSTQVREFSRLALGSIRLLNGVAALVTPRVVARRLGADDERGILYILRLFGVRTVILGAELLFLDGELLERSVRMAPIIHASDTASAVISGARGYLPHRAAVLTTLISAINTVLALLAQDFDGTSRNGRGTTADPRHLVTRKREQV
jgi:uncharacterized protein YjeT (DUF2065 family)